MKISLLAIISFLFFACKQTPQDTFPNKIVSEKTAEHIHIKGTNVFIKPVSNFKYHNGSGAPTDLGEYKDDTDEYTTLKIVQQSAPFSIFQSSIKDVAAFEAKTKSKVNIFKNVQINDYKGLYVEYHSPQFPGNTAIMFIYGDETVSFMVNATFETFDTKAKQELQQMIQSLVYDKDATPTLAELANFEVDLSITQFEFSTLEQGNSFVYAPKDSLSNIGATFYIMPLPNFKEDKAIKFVENLLVEFETQGQGKLENKTLQKTVINGYPSLVVESIFVTDESKSNVYLVLLNGKNSSVVFCALVLQTQADYLDLCKKTASTLRIKD